MIFTHQHLAWFEGIIFTHQTFGLGLRCAYSQRSSYYKLLTKSIWPNQQSSSTTRDDWNIVISMEYKQWFSATVYIADFLKPVASVSRRSTLRSASNESLIIPATKTAFGTRAFCVTGPTYWNQLPETVKNAATVDTRIIWTFIFFIGCMTFYKHLYRALAFGLGHVTALEYCPIIIIIII